jgi:hypothetical protein
LIIQIDSNNTGKFKAVIVEDFKTIYSIYFAENNPKFEQGIKEWARSITRDRSITPEVYHMYLSIYEFRYDGIRYKIPDELYVSQVYGKDRLTLEHIDDKRLRDYINHKGRGRSSTYRPTNERLQIKNAQRVIYKNNLGRKYIKWNKEWIPLSKVKSLVEKQ